MQWRQNSSNPLNRGVHVTYHAACRTGRERQRGTRIPGAGPHVTEVAGRPDELAPRQSGRRAAVLQIHSLFGLLAGIVVGS